MKTYYAFEGEIRYYAPLPKTVEIVQAGAELGAAGDFQGTLGPPLADPSRWKEPPHVVLANLSGGQAIEAFIRKYGPLLGRRTHMMLKDGAPQFYENIAHFKSFQETVRRAWSGEEAAVKEIERRVGLVGSGRILLSVKNGSFEANVPDLERFICILVLRDRANGKVAVCENPDCPASCFLRSRKGQTFCTHKCAVLINVRKFRQAQAEKNRRKK